tara:strand:- start:141 stop:701 length:561 start_codon:yes stop_codon:yes gene_type:complete
MATLLGILGGKRRKSRRKRKTKRRKTRRVKSPKKKRTRRRRKKRRGNKGKSIKRTRMKRGGSILIESGLKLMNEIKDEKGPDAFDIYIPIVQATEPAPRRDFTTGIFKNYKLSLDHDQDEYKRNAPITAKTRFYLQDLKSRIWGERPRRREVNAKRLIYNTHLTFITPKEEAKKLWAAALLKPPVV